ncbi:glycerol-3-phosphate 1-O-acyltransferase PlsY [Mesorhizobium sp. RP14(2022)]|uniref:Glycerol-3-phosphate acyltransferase n=1 Tax=Mesorhizobium liriopis TaxID=2953882 RepID=A0ABT1CAY2_9HYPH|nr:glycerol-3-phosphate 1-O-acyltransferase PlsY [Mesorhizobium liriopis]MCO6051974.1 glycerol-3-phosphate 1-O-acyltransferase PlsY [Mesorhizobium liriopis]
MSQGYGLLLAAFVFGYLLGSIPFGLVLTRLAGMGDVRKIGSGNIGATNVLRTGNKKLAVATLLLDAFKGTVAVLVAHHFFGLEAGLAAGFGAFLGHLFPVWLGFKGGKGVATYLGLLLAICWQAALAFAVVWLAAAFAFRYSSLAALLGVVAAPLAALYFSLPMVTVLLAVMSLIVFSKHHANIKRLLAGTESRIGSKG